MSQSVHQDYTYKLTCPVCSEESEYHLVADIHKHYADRLRPEDGGRILTSFKCVPCGEPIQMHTALSIYGVLSMALGDPNRPMSDTVLSLPKEFDKDFVQVSTVRCPFNDEDCVPAMMQAHIRFEHWDEVWEIVQIEGRGAQSVCPFCDKSIYQNATRDHVFIDHLDELWDALQDYKWGEEG